ncbi:MAG: hypothetical protein E7576_10120 [Ruminococcaceae bacterium]|jgi:hypothetical protein|nr:hypothetical protein [Oscillospiraceae bacterium]
MTDRVQATDTAALRKAFQNGKGGEGPFIYYPLDSGRDADKPERMAKLLSGYKRSGFRGVIPFSYKEYAYAPLSEDWEELYERVAAGAKENALSLGYLDDTYVMRAYIAGLDDPASACCRILSCYEYACTEMSLFKKKLKKTGVRMSICAVNDDDLTILDLREFVREDVLEWQVPAGNWNVNEFVCESDPESNYVDLMDYAVSAEYLKNTFGALEDRLSQAGISFEVFIYRNVLFAGKNRRMWHPDFNERFREMFGFDVAPYYPLLFRDFAGKSGRYRALIMTCRSRMMTDGYLKAAADLCMARDVFCTGYAAEAKATFGSWLFGDGQLLHRYASAPGISMPFAYLYGLNAVKVASGFADQSGADTVCADLFKYFSMLTKDIIYRESMNAFVRGVNMTFVHLGEDRTREQTDIVESDPGVFGSIFSKGDDLSDYASFVNRIQTVLRGGEHVAETGIVYPIHSLHSYVYLYQSERTEFEYPSTPENADYMELMNNFLNYVGNDSVFLHPDVLAERAFSEDGVLYIPTERGTMKFKMLVLPSMTLVSLKTLRVIKKFFDCGGKIIATDSLPTMASEAPAAQMDINRALRYESPEDEEVDALIRGLFGDNVTDPHVIRSHYKNENEQGGIAYFFPANRTTIDGTDTVTADILLQATHNFHINFDVYAEKRPKVEFLGVVNQHLPDFLKIGIDRRLARGCSMNCIHKKYAGSEIYFITNTTGNDYRGHVLLRGRLVPEEWNPANGKVKKCVSETVRVSGEIYTRVALELEASSCVFLVSPSVRTQRELIRDLTEGEDIPEYFLRD